MKAPILRIRGEDGLFYAVTAIRGEKGEPGSAGPKGDTGETGIQGYTFTPSVDTNGNLSWTNDSNGVLSNPSSVNIKGPKGDDGENGQNGTNGETGATFTPAVDESGYLSWTNDKGLNNPATVNLKGPTGDTGPQGIQGETGPKGDKGDPYTLTDTDKNTIVQAVLDALPNGDEVSY